jgi:hypothetical protein
MSSPESTDILWQQYYRAGKHPQGGEAQVHPAFREVSLP